MNAVLGKLARVSGRYPLSLRAKVLLLAILPLVLVAGSITLVSVEQARNLSEEEILTFESHLLESKRRELRNYIQLALTSIDHIVRDERMDEDRAQAEVKRILNELTYGEDGYFFVYDRNGVNLVHPILDELVGQNLYDLQDINGDYVIRSLLRVAIEGGGYHRYVWNKPSTGREEEKISYAISIPRWGWMLGTGLYIDDIAKEVARTRTQVTHNIRNTFLTVLSIVVGTVIVIALVSITTNLRESRLADARLRELAHRAIRFQVNERRRFSRELHDGINQLMVSVKFRIESAVNKLAKAQEAAPQRPELVRTRQDLEKGKMVLNDAIQEVRRISHDLRPRLLDDLGLEAALDNLVDQFRERTRLPTSLVFSLSHARLPDDVEITLYRVVQEALTNIERHAGPCKVQLKLHQKGANVHLEIYDNGRGFEPTAMPRHEGIGLGNMRERIELFGGEFDLHSDPATGTRLGAWLPIEA